MSILIKGMEMPEDGCHHMICIYADGTVSTGGREYTAVPVPPHGRLIDADALEKSLSEELLSNDKKHIESTWNDAVAVVFVAPTIIKAEETKGGINMGVYIKGMEIPKSCANCEWSRLSKMDLGMSCFCTLVKKIGSLEIAKNNRMDFCPLVPVPPHGRLIDADAAYEKIQNIFGGVDSAVLLDEDFAPTIIPASEEGD